MGAAMDLRPGQLRRHFLIGRNLHHLPEPTRPTEPSRPAPTGTWHINLLLQRQPPDTERAPSARPPAGVVARPRAVVRLLDLPLVLSKI